MSGTRVTATSVRVVDGDTLRVEVNGAEESLRLLGLDTEETHSGGTKPVTPWGRAAKEEARRLIAEGDEVTLEFPGDESPEVCWKKYRGNYGRPLVHVFLSDGTDYQEYMIREGFSPYFVKYGYAVFAELHERYIEAEREAQIARRGVWDQLSVNGTEVRNYARLGVWWHLRAQLIDRYRRFREEHPDALLLNTRNDYERLVELADEEADATIFTELRDARRVGGIHAVIGIGAHYQPFEIFIPQVDQPNQQKVMNLLAERYLPSDLEHPRRSYAYVSGSLHVYRGTPQMTVTREIQITDRPNLA